MNELERLVKRCNEMDITEQQNYLGDAILPTLAAEELAEIRKRIEWQPIETAPKDGSSIIAHGKRFNKMICWWNGKSWRIVYSNILLKPTHWLPIPGPPKEREG